VRGNVKVGTTGGAENCLTLEPKKKILAISKSVRHTERFERRPSKPRIFRVKDRLTFARLSGIGFWVPRVLREPNDDTGVPCLLALRNDRESALSDAAGTDFPLALLAQVVARVHEKAKRGPRPLHSL
jgi:hypothetical protein